MATYQIKSLFITSQYIWPYHNDTYTK
ncbi:hypothetical protein F383_27328 [Gossypium arboreum]|uniref:Uncharacterized protein n=2 Tax=Gossypium arboreum TaxID=29729 RepID=A0A0B0P9Y9_GOSAR|nr:hypothetical protein F383_27328 [Gossypium arboreum]